MSLDGKVLSRAIRRLESRRRRREEETSALRARVYKEYPRVAEIDKQLAGALAEAARIALSRNKDPERAVIETARRNLELQAERAELLVKAGYPEKCLDDDPLCNKCNDRGYIYGAKPCECLMILYADEQKKELSALLKLGVDTFETFKLSYYSDQYDNETGTSPRENMEVVFETCRQYAKRFIRGTSNLFLTGGPGLGKTFLSTCIAKEVSENGFSVVYDTAVSIFAKFESGKFSRSSDSEELQDEISRYMKCDLLILDDLGTELITAFTISALYDLINTRLTSRKQTIINSNLSIDDIKRKYSPQIASRLEGEYQKLTFCGDDIRQLRES